MTSFLETYDLDTGATATVLTTDRLIEAPNWSPDGAFLVVNGDGRLWRVDLDAPALAAIDTGFAVDCNNDHGISPDGTMLVISDSTRPGGSRLYTLPIGGGEPAEVTPEAPSYWHGWSPDGRQLAYCAQRDGSYGIHVVPVEGGEERRLTGSDGHADGPDYSADGAWIWFNGSQGGTMQLWRVRPDGMVPDGMGPDGTVLERMTDDDRTNWFPHPSPDGASVLYLAYEGGTDGHPRDREVELRLLDLATGAVRTLVALFGGQGSINVPCWHASGRRFAFVRYARP